MAESDIDTYKDVGELLNISTQTLTAIFGSRQMPTVQQGIDICEAYGFSANWLFLGKGEKLMKDQATLEKIFARLQKIGLKYNL